MSVAALRPGVGELPAGLGDEAPLVTAGVQGQRQHAERVGVVDLAVRFDRTQAIVTPAAGAHHELTNAARISIAGGVLWREALVVVIVADESDIDSAVVGGLVEGRHVAIVAVLAG